MFTHPNRMYNNTSYYVLGLKGDRRPRAKVMSKKPCDSCIAPPSGYSIEALLTKEIKARMELSVEAEALKVAAAAAKFSSSYDLGVVFEKSPVTVLTDNFDTGVMQKEKDVLLLLYVPWCDWCKRIASDYIKATERLASNSKVELMVVDVTQRQLTHPKVEIQGFPTVFLFKNVDKANPVEYNGDRSADDLVKFVNMHVGGNVEVETPNVQLKIAELDSSKLIDMTDNFDSVVMNNDNDVLVMFYAPWCSWCIKMMPDIEALAQQYSGNKKISIVRVDATAHEAAHEKVKIYGIPLVHLFKGNDKANPVEYNGPRSKDDIAMFIEENAVNK